MAKLYVGNLSFDVTDDGLLQLFTGNGFQVESARVIRDMNTGRSRGFGFVEMAAGEDATRAITQLNGFNFEGRALVVNEARPQAPRSGGGHGGGGGGREGRGGGRGGRGGGGGGGRAGRY
jgi:RNA recognition motif-containing protein